MCEHKWKKIWGGSVRRCGECRRIEWYHYCTNEYRGYPSGEVMATHKIPLDRSRWSEVYGFETWNEWNKKPIPILNYELDGGRYGTPTEELKRLLPEGMQ